MLRNGCLCCGGIWLTAWLSEEAIRCLGGESSWKPKELMNMRINILPKTSLGRWSVWLAVAWILFFVLSMFAAESGLVKLPLSGRALDFAMLGVTGGISVASFITGLISIIKSGERSILVFLALVVALLIVAMAILEVVTGGLG
jgi:hypothetical protein